MHTRLCLGALLSVAAIATLTSAMIYKLQMPENLQTFFDGARVMHNASEIPGEQIFWECMQHIMWRMAQQMGPNVTMETRDYLDRLLHVAMENRVSQVPRFRREYRMLTENEREKFHKAVKALKEDTSLSPNIYSAFAELHAGGIIPHAHFGANFVGWHRIFLLIFETALRLKDPTVSVPYWASNLDAELEDPTTSIIWSDKFFGNGDGFVITGPFADFKVVSSDSRLSRNIGAAGSLFTNEGIHGILQQEHLVNISSPGAPYSTNIELQHNGVHGWVGGNMDDLSTGAEDPLFHIHHSFVDYLWEEFRTRQKLKGIDPQSDFPNTEYGSEKHHPEAPLGFGDLRNMDALSDLFADLVKYEPSPSCTRSRPHCGSKYLKCNTNHSPPICVSLMIEDDPNTSEHMCVEPQLRSAIQNSFAINRYCDIRSWAYIPVKVVLQRPPEFSQYKAYPVINNEPIPGRDVFSTISIDKNTSRHLATYPNCRSTNSVARKIYIESHGLNYYGKYKDFTVLDQRHALSEAMTYLGVKSPDVNYTDAIVYSYDYCGRTCRPYCLDAFVDPPKYRPCAGVIRVTSEFPKLYGNSYAAAVNTVWRGDSPDDLPEVHLQSPSITFYCDYSGAWPWLKDFQQAAAPNPSQRSDARTTTVVKTQSASRSSSSRTQVTRTQTARQRTTAIQLPRRLALAGSGRDRTSRVTDVRVITRPVAEQRRGDSLPTRTLDLSHTPMFPVPPRPVGRAGPNWRTAETVVNRRPLFRPLNLRPHVNPSITGRSGMAECRLGPGCYLPVPCSPCQPRSRVRCRGTQQADVICVNGIFMLEQVVSFLGG